MESNIRKVLRPVGVKMEESEGSTLANSLNKNSWGFLMFGKLSRSLVVSKLACILALYF